MTTRSDAILDAIREEIERHPEFDKDDGLDRVTIIVRLKRRTSTPKVLNVLSKAEWMREVG